MHLYIIQSQLNHKYYIGVTNNLNRRVYEHNNGKEKTTRPYLPWNLVYYEIYNTKSLAMKRERFIKKQKSHKWIDELITNGSLAQR